MAKRDCKSEPQATEVPQPTHRCEFHSSALHHGLFLRGEWLEQAGFITFTIKLVDLKDDSLLCR
ncbi:MULTISPECIES: type I toxin-antitoxin system SymE family toxin [Erwinia]|uniref:type I toxin-antitoxin system SymE family toxin n=1 Tax=Erwinia TaxID=551 RepID=UPI0014150DA7|nr:type I toxin-antitoxin system SymE family toxin [Erwinia aphidicola]MCP2231645.1 hypothetical protein [Erwinia aphidicola]